MKLINDFLFRYQVDVSRSLAILLFASALGDLYINLGGLVAGKLLIHLGFLLSLPLGIALWRYHPFARALCIGGAWFFLALIAFFFLVATSGGSWFQGNLTFTVSLGDQTIENPSILQSVSVLAIQAMVSLLFLGVMHSEKFRQETNHEELAFT